MAKIESGSTNITMDQHTNDNGSTNDNFDYFEQMDTDEFNAFLDTFDSTPVAATSTDVFLTYLQTLDAHGAYVPRLGEKRGA